MDRGLAPPVSSSVLVLREPLGGGFEFVAIRCPLSAPESADLKNPIYQNDGRHVLESVDGQTFGLVVWGWDSFVSYGYPGGSNVERINVP